MPGYTNIYMVISMRHVFILLACLLVVHTSAASDWSCFKGSPERTSCSDTLAPDTCYLNWKVETESELYSSPVVKNQNVFQVTFEEVLCIDLDSGEVVWTSSVPAYHSTPALSDGKMTVATNRGITAISTETGDVAWEYEVSGRFSKRFLLRDYIVSSPVVCEGNIVVGTMPYQFLVADGIWIDKRDDLYVICLDEQNGKEKWHVKTVLGVRSSPCISNGKVFVASREILCIDLEKGKIIWNSEDKYPYDTGKSKKERYAFDYSTPALYHGILIGGSCVMGWEVEEQRSLGWHKIVAVDQYTGDIFWEWVKEGALASFPAVYKGKIYVYSHDGMVRCLSLLDGETVWETAISEPREYETKEFRLWPSPAAADGKVYIGSIEGVFYCLDALTGSVLWKYETGDQIHSAPAVVSGKVLISSTDGSLYCFGIDPETYKLKAEKYIENEDYKKAEELLMAAKAYARTDEEIKEIDTLLHIVKAEMPEYQERLNQLSEAESLMDEADEIIWNKKFKEAKNLYTKAFGIYKAYNDEFGISFCEKRIDYIEKRIEQQNGIEPYWWLFIILICIFLAFLFVLKKYHR